MKKVYVNPKQKAFLESPQRFKDIIGGVGSGKTGLMGFHNFQKMGNMPGAKSGLAALTYNQLLNNSLPSMERTWRACGLKEHTAQEPGHYVIGVRPPSWFKRPINPPRKLDNVISFFNGYCIQLISADRPDTIRGISLDALDVDEKGWLKEEFFNKVLVARVRDNNFESFSKHPLHHSICGYSSMPWLVKQQWILNVEELAKARPDKYFYIESTAEDNIEILGKDYLEDARERLPNIVFLVEYMNYRPKKVSQGFYPAFNDEIHCIYLTFDYDQNEAGLWVSKANDCNPFAPKELSFDFNAAFTSALVCQEQGQEFRVCDELFVEQAPENSNLIKEITSIFIEKYSGHENKDVFIHGDRNGNNKSPGSNDTFYNQIEKQLKAAGFFPYLMVSGLDSPHKKRYLLINEIFSEKSDNLPRIRINQNTCKYLPIALQLAPMIGDFQKDKNSEKSGDQKKATHLTDCLDNIIMRKYGNFLEADVEYYDALIR